MAISTDSLSQGPSSFHGVFGEMWLATATINPASVAAEASGTDTVTVPGVKLGDHVISWAPGVTIDSNLIVQVWVSANDTVTVMYSNSNAAAGAAIDVASSSWSFLIGRPRTSGNPV